MNRRSVVVAKTALLVSFPPALILSLNACSFSFSTNSFEGDKLAANVEKQLMDSNPGLTVSSTHCADTPDIEAGQTTSCTALVDGQPSTLTVTWKNSDGDYEVNAVAG